MRYLITGGLGFIGCNLALNLAKEHEVTVIDDMSSPSSMRGVVMDNPNIRVFRTSILDIMEVNLAMRGADVVIHLAAISSVEHSMLEPMHCYCVNLNGGINVLTAAVNARVKKFIFASSCAALFPKSPYGASKKVFDDILKSVEQIYESPKITSLKFFNVYGPGQRANGYAAVIPIFINAALDNDYLKVTGSGEQTRDFIYVDDVIDAIKTAPEGYYQVGTGVSDSVNDIAAIIRGAVGKGKIVHVAARPGEDLYVRSDPSQFPPGWKAKEGLFNGLSKTIQYYNR